MKLARVAVGVVLIFAGLVGLGTVFLNHHYLYTVSARSAALFVVSIAGFVLVHDGWHFVRSGFK